MVVTRSRTRDASAQAQSALKSDASSKKTFSPIDMASDNDSQKSNLGLESPNDSSDESAHDSPEESADDSDEAPEEESISVSKRAVLEKQQKIKALEQKQRQQERNRRKELDLQNQKQQEEKRRQEKLKQERLAQMTKELPDLLPDDLLEEEVESKHILEEDFEREHEEMRKRMKIEKLKKLKELKNQAVKKGPVYVQVQSHDPRRKRVPRAESVVVETRASWLQRESLGKK